METSKSRSFKHWYCPSLYHNIIILSLNFIEFVFRLILIVDSLKIFLACVNYLKLTYLTYFYFWRSYHILFLIFITSVTYGR